jgi:hypothetical protein
VLDTNGYVTNVIFSWGDGSSDALTITGHPQYISDSIKHYYSADGTYNALISVLDDDNFVSTRPIAITRTAPPPRVWALKDTFVTIEGANPQLTTALHFEATADIAHGLVSSYIWFLSTPYSLDSGNTNLWYTFDSVCDIRSGSDYWTTHGYLKCDTVYQGAVMAYYDDGMTALDTFYFWSERSRGWVPPTIVTNCKVGAGGDSSHFEYSTADSLDSFYVDIASVSMYLNVGDTVAPEHYEAKIQLIVDRLADYNTGSAVYTYGDTVYTRDFERISSFMEWLPQGDARDSRRRWRFAWRPEQDFFSAYAGPVGRLEYHFRVTIRSRSGLHGSTSDIRLYTDQLPGI